ncbi:hypothetical protein BDP27DRAFT_840441 [Rhodocollybia butyracea]|uniref:Uncharacterized protein n=1 Tax=Rhodocollybia butyracea TaxID=206335 RepID=A0A9P5PTD4_9AGAR|nr:hypothetical protein BDP27DRAFT_840441 [Rhodocollybia butyracea]
MALIICIAFLSPRKAQEAKVVQIGYTFREYVTFPLPDFMSHIPVLVISNNALENLLTRWPAPLPATPVELGVLWFYLSPELRRWPGDIAKGIQPYAPVIMSTRSQLLF